MRVKIVNERGSRTVLVNDEDVSNYTSHWSISGVAGDFRTVTLTLVPDEVEYEDYRFE